MQRGTITPINGELNRPTTKCGLDYHVVCLAAAVAVAALVIGCATPSSLFSTPKLFAYLLVPMVLGGGTILTKYEPQIIKLALLSLRQAAVYDPGL